MAANSIAVLASCQECFKSFLINLEFHNGNSEKRSKELLLLYFLLRPVILHRSFTNRFRKARGGLSLLPIRASPKIKLEKLNASAAMRFWFSASKASFSPCRSFLNTRSIKTLEPVSDMTSNSLVAGARYLTFTTISAARPRENLCIPAGKPAWTDMPASACARSRFMRTRLSTTCSAFSWPCGCWSGAAACPDARWFGPAPRNSDRKEKAAKGACCVLQRHSRLEKHSSLAASQTPS